MRAKSKLSQRVRLVWEYPITLNAAGMPSPKSLIESDDDLHNVFALLSAKAPAYVAPVSVITVRARGRGAKDKPMLRRVKWSVPPYVAMKMERLHPNLRALRAAEEPD